MKKILIVFIFIISMLFVSCLENRIAKSWTDSTDLPLPAVPTYFYLTGEITSKQKINIDSEFEIKVGIAKIQSGSRNYSTANLSISAENFIITDQNGNQFQDTYSFDYNDFADEKYLGTKDNINYYETFKFKYIGDTDYKFKAISFKISSEDFVIEDYDPVYEIIEIYYEVDNNKMYITTSRNPNLRGTITFKQYFKAILYYFIWFNVIAIIIFVIVFIFIKIKKKKNKIIDNNQQNNNDNLVE